MPALLDKAVHALWLSEAKAGRPPSPRLVAEMQYSLTVNWHHEDAFLGTACKIDPTSPRKQIFVREASRGSGKALSLDTPILTTSGWKTMGSLSVGDQVFDESGKPCKVVAATEVQYGRPCHEVHFSDGSHIIADADHLWHTQTKANRNRRHEKDKKFYRDPHPGSVKSTVEIARTLLVKNGKSYNEYNHSIDAAKPLEFPTADLPIDPYVLGAWLGDGATAGARITSADIEVIEEIRKAGYPVKRVPKTPYCWSISDGIRTGATKECFLVDLRRLGVLGNKHIPESYLLASAEQRMALLQGLMDTDGTCSKDGHSSYTSTLRHLAEQFYRLASSLGLVPHWSEKQPSIPGRPQAICKRAYTINFVTKTPVFRLSRKLARQSEAAAKTFAGGRRSITGVVPVESIPVRCIQVDSPSKLYLAGNGCIPTHNSTLAAFRRLYLMEYVIPFLFRPGLPIRPENLNYLVMGRDQNHIRDDIVTPLKNLIVQYAPWLRTRNWEDLIENADDPSPEGLRQLAEMKSKGGQKWEAYRIDLDNGTSIRTRTLNQSVRVLHVFAGDMDDPLTEQNVGDSTIIKANVQAGILPAIEPGGIFLIDGTPQGPSDLFAQLKAEAEADIAAGREPSVDYLAHPAYDEDGTRGYADRNRAHLGAAFDSLAPMDRPCLWPARLPWASLEQARGSTRESEIAFAREYMLSRTPVDTLLVHPEDMAAAKDRNISYHPRGLPSHTYYGGLDPSGLRKDEAGICLGFVLDGAKSPADKGVRVLAHLEGMPIQPHLAAGEGEMQVVNKLNETATRFGCWKWMIEKNGFQGIIGVLARQLNPSIGTPDTFHLGSNKHTENGWLGLRTVFRNRQIRLPYATEEDRAITDKLCFQLMGLQKIDGKVQEDPKRKNDLASAFFLFLKATEASEPVFSASAIEAPGQHFSSANILRPARQEGSAELRRHEQRPRQDNSLPAIMSRLNKWQAPRRR